MNNVPQIAHLSWKVGLVVVIGYALLLLVSFLPQERIIANVSNMAKEGAFVKNYPKYLFWQVDLYTECVGIGGAVNLRPSLESLLAVRNFGECTALTNYARQPSEVPPQAYPRYIHGGQIVLKPFYTYLSFTQIRLMTTLISVLLLLAMVCMAYKNTGKAFALALAGSFLFVFNWHVFLLVTHAVQFWVVLIGALFALRYEKTHPPAGLFGVLGASDAVISFLSMGSLSLGFPLLCLCLARWHKGESPRKIIVFGFWASVAWSIGFVTPWGIKWILTLAFLPPEVNLLGEALCQYPAKNIAMVGEALFKDLNYTIWPLWMMVFIVLGVRYYKLKLKQPKGIWVLLLPAIVPIIWISLLPGQSGIRHAFFVEIILWPTLASMLFFLLDLNRKTVSNEFPVLEVQPSSISRPTG
ncbi:MAG: hypothetical protein AB1585_19300 [Thermodesulfobacteriota bacterium]